MVARERKPSDVFAGSRFRRWLSGRLGRRDWLRRFLRGSFWHSLGTIAAKLIGLIANFVLARILGVDGFGRLSFVQNSITTASAIASVGLGMVTTKHVAEFRQQPTRLGGIVSLAVLFAAMGGACVGFGLVWFSEPIAAVLLSPSERPYIRLTGYGVGFAVIVSISANILIGLEAFKRNAALQVATGLATGLLTVIAGWRYGVDASINALIASLILGFAIALVLVALTLRRTTIRFSWRGTLNERGILFRYSLPSFLSGLAVVVSGWLARAIIIRASGFSELGIYAAANQFFMVITTLNGMFGAVLLPVYVSQRAAGQSTGEEHELDFFNLMFSWTFSVVVMGGLLLFSEVIGELLGSDYGGPTWSRVLGLVLLSATLVAHRQGIVRIVLERGLMWFALFGNVIWAVLVLVFTYALKTEGALGLALAMALTYLLNTLAVCPLYYTMKLLPGYFLFSKYCWIVWLSVFGMIAAPWLTSNFWLSKLAVLLCYLVSLGALSVLWRNRKQLCDPSLTPSR